MPRILDHLLGGLLFLFLSAIAPSTAMAIGDFTVQATSSDFVILPKQSASTQIIVASGVVVLFTCADYLVSATSSPSGLGLTMDSPHLCIYPNQQAFPTLIVDASAASPGTYVITVVVGLCTSSSCTSFSLTHTITIAVTVLASLGNPPVMSASISLDSVDPVQAIYNPDAIVVGKPTLLRTQLTVRVFPPPVAAVRVPVKIKLTYDDTMNFAQFRGFPLRTTINEDVFVPPGTSVLYLPLTRVNPLNHLEYFILPPLNPLFGAQKTFNATVEIDPDNEAFDVDPNNQVFFITKLNSPKTVSLPVKPTYPFRILYAPLAVDGGPPPPSCPDLQKLAADSTDFIDGVFPINPKESPHKTDCTVLPVKVSESEWFKGGAYNFTYMNERLYLIGQLQLQSSFDEIVAVPHYNIGFPISGQACPGTGCKAALVMVPLPDLTAHEVTHTFGWVRPDSPIVDTTDPCLCHARLIPAPGYFVAKRCEMGSFDFVDKQCHPGDGNDYMYKSGGSWASSYTYNYLLSQLKADPDPKLIVISGRVGRDGTTILDPWYRLEGIPDIQLGHPGEYTILYLDPNGNATAQTAFDLRFIDFENGGRALDFAGFILKVPDVDGTAKIVIKHGEQLLAERVISPNPPQVRLISPNGGEKIQAGHPISVTWEASDPDGDTLAYALSFSDDNGQTWIPLCVDVSSQNGLQGCRGLSQNLVTEFTFRLSPSVRTNSALIRVRATDGVNTTTKMSASPFSIVAPSETPANWQLAISDHYVQFRQTAGTILQLNGPNTSFTRFMNSWFGLEASASVAFGRSPTGQTATFLWYGGGPHLAYRSKAKLEPWVHGLFGSPLFHLQTNLNAFGVMIGCGIDIKVKPRVYWRVQGDYLGTRFFSTTQNSFQGVSGLVFNF